jgi:hypothetical protein
MSSRCAALDRGRGAAISGRNVVAMNHFVTLSFVVLLVALVVALDASLALKAIDRLAQSEGYIDIQSVMTPTDGPIH